MIRQQLSSETISVADARANLSDILGKVYYTNTSVMVERNGKPVAVVISPAQWDRYQQLAKDRFFAAVDQLHALNVDADPTAVEDAMTAAVEEVRRERYEQRQP